MAEIKTGMEKADMKRLLGLSKKEPVNCAMAFGSEPNAGLLLLDKNKQGQILHKELLKTFPDAKNIRWGSAFVDLDDDPKLVKFTINNKVSSMAKRLVKTLKGTGFSKVIILLDDGSTVESHGEEEAEEGIPDAPPPPPPPPGLDAAQLQKILGALIPRIGPAAGENAALKAQLSKFAGDAVAHIKANELTDAATALQHLKKGIETAATTPVPSTQAPSEPTDTAATAGAVVYAKSRLAWIAARKKMESEIDKLRSEILNTYQADGIGPDLDKRYKERTAPIFEALDEELADKLDDANNATDPATRAKLVAEARAVMTRYETFLASDKIIADLDTNPFVPLAIRSTITATLSALSKTVR